MTTCDFMLNLWSIIERNVRNKSEIFAYFSEMNDAGHQSTCWDDVLTHYEVLSHLKGFPGTARAKHELLNDRIPSGDGVSKTIRRWANNDNKGSAQTFIFYTLMFFTYLYDTSNASLMRDVLSFCFETMEGDYSSKTVDSITNDEDIEQQLAVVVAALHHCLCLDGVVPPHDDCDRWYNDYLVVNSVEPTIIRYLWDQLKAGVIDTRSDMFRAMSKYKAFNLANFYELPVLSSNVPTARTLMNTPAPLRAALRAPSGYGKSTYLAALLLSITLDSAESLGILSEPAEIEAFEQLRKRLLPSNYKKNSGVLPIYVTGEAYNAYVSRNGQKQPVSFEDVFIASLPTVITEHEKQLLIDYIHTRCRDGQVLFVCDAFDEVHASNRAYYMSNFAAFNSPAYESADVIISYRPIHDAFAFEKQNHISVVWEIEPLKNWGGSKIRSFIQRYVDLFSILGTSDRNKLGQRLLANLQDIPEYTPFLENPFLVSMFVFHSTRSDNQTANIYQMVWHIAHDLIARFKYTYGHDISSPHFERTDYNALLSKLAYSMCDQAEISHGDLIDTLSELDSDRKVNWSSIIGEDINSKAGILVPVRDEGGSRIQYQFQARNTIVPLLASQAIFERLYERTKTLDFFDLDESNQKKVFEKHLLHTLKSLSDESVAACTQYIVAALCNGIGRKRIDEFLATYGSILCARTLMDRIAQLDGDWCKWILHSLRRLLALEFAVTCFNNGTLDPECLATAEAILRQINS